MESNQAFDLIWVKEKAEKANQEEYGFPISFREDEVLMGGGLFSKEYQKCLVITNTEHGSNYFEFCIMARKTGKVATMSLYYTGSSKNIGNKNFKEANERKGLSGLVLSKMSGFNQAAYDQENDYYDSVIQMLSEIFGSTIK